MIKEAILLAVVCSMGTALQAGDWGKAPVGKIPIEECYDIGGQISAGYMTDYYYHGLHAAEDSVWVDVNYTFSNLAVPVTVGVWYLNGFDDGYTFDHLRVYTSVALGTFFGFDTSVGYTHHFFPELGGDPESFGEVSLKLRRSLGFVDLLLGTNYMTGNTGGQSSWGWYHEIGLEKSFAITDSVDLVLAGGTGYVDGLIYLSTARNGPSSAWNQYCLRASLPIQLNCRTTLTPYIAYFWYDDFFGRNDVSDTRDNLHGGVSITVNF